MTQPAGSVRRLFALTTISFFIGSVRSGINAEPKMADPKVLALGMTNLVRLHVLLSSEQMANFERFRERDGKRTKKEAARELIRLGLRAAQDRSTQVREL